jgi:thioredoxin-related protein
MSLLKYCLPAMLLFLTLHVQGQEIKWMSWEEAAAANDKQPKKIFVDIYTDWCGWCKKMDASTFMEPDVIQELNEKFYSVKLNAEQKESIFWRDQEFKWFAGGRSGVHKLAYDLLDGQMSYPTFVILDQEYSRILASPGYQDGKTLLKELHFASGEYYKTTTWEAFKVKNEK